LTDLAALVVRLQADNSQYMAALDQATGKLAKFSKDQSDLLGGLAQKLGAAFTIDRLVEFSASTLEAAADLSRMSQSSGIAVEDLSALEFAARASGVAGDSLGISLKKLNVSIADAAANAGSKAGLAFAAMGVSIKNADGTTKSAGDVLDSVATKFAGYADGANKVKLATDLFGKSGETLIPLLNQGAAGIEELKAQAEAAGAVISGQTAAAAELFNNKMLLLKTTLIDGVAAQLEAQLLPTLNDLGNVMLSVSKNSANLEGVAEGLAVGLKLLVSAAIEIKAEFVQVGDAIGGAAAAVAAAAHGNFKEAWGILNDQSAQAKLAQAGAVDAIAATWAAGGEKIVASAAETATKVKAQAPVVIDLKPFLDKLEAFKTSLGDEVAKLDQGTIAATRYKLAHGEMANALSQTGAAGQKLKTDILALAGALESAQISKEVQDIGAQLRDLAGDTVTAGIVKFAASTQTLVRRLNDLGGAAGAAGIAQVQALQTATTYQLEFNKAVTDASRIQTDLALAEETTNNALKSGAISELEALRQLDAERVIAATQLGAIAAQESAIATAAGNPALQNQAKQAAIAVDNLKASTNSLEQSVRTGLEGAFANNFADLITGAKSFGDAFKSLAKDIEKQMADMISKNFAQNLFGTGGAAGGLSGLLAGLVGAGGASNFGVTNAVIPGVTQNGGMGGGIGNIVGGFAAGGTIPSGKFGIVGEGGPELAYSGAKDLTIIPQDRSMGNDVTVHNHFTVQAPGGTISRQSQMQTAAAAARSLGQANRRNNT
jgi:hypothetical protein